MASFMYVPFMLVFHHSKSINTNKRMLFYYHHVCILMFFYVLVCSVLLHCML